MPKRKRADYCCAKTRREKSKLQKSREVRILDDGCTKGRLLLNGRHFAMTRSMTVSRVSPLSAGIMLGLRRRRSFPAQNIKRQQADSVRFMERYCSLVTNKLKEPVVGPPKGNKREIGRF